LKEWRPVLGSLSRVIELGLLDQLADALRSAGVGFQLGETPPQGDLELVRSAK